MFSLLFLGYALEYIDVILFFMFIYMSEDLKIIV
jgi:hypothetical protein